MKLRVRSAEVVARMMADRLVGGKVRIQMMKFLPALFGDAMRDTPSIAVQLLESTSETPELIWTDDMKTRLSTVYNNQNYSIILSLSIINQLLIKGFFLLVLHYLSN